MRVPGVGRVPIARFTPAGADPDSVIDVRAVFQQGHRELAVDALPPVLLPRKGRFGLIDYEKVFCPDPDAGDIFDLRGIDRDAGCVVVVRPDQYVAARPPAATPTRRWPTSSRASLSRSGDRSW